MFFIEPQKWQNWAKEQSCRIFVAVTIFPIIYKRAMRTSKRPGPLTAAFDRGPAKYFHGRKRILHDFKELLVRAEQTKSGTTFLIQGAPGAGKTALLHECEKLARSAKWKTTNIDPTALWEPEILRHSLSRRRTPKVVSSSIRIGSKDIVDAELQVEWSQLTILRILQSTRKPLLLKLDEAQRTGAIIFHKKLTSSQSRPMYFMQFTTVNWIGQSY